MATTRAPPLLTIPREIRDQIYGYLYCKLELRHAPLQDLEAVRLTVTNAPIISVLLTHSRLRDEYSESRWFRYLSLNIQRGLKTKPDRGFVGTDRRDRADLKLVRDANIDYTFHAGNAMEVARFDYLVHDLQNNAPLLHTLRISRRILVDYYTPRKLPRVETLRQQCLLSPLSRNMRTLPLLQHVIGRILSFDPHDNHHEHHKVQEFAVSLFAASKAEEHMWTAQEMIDWLIEPYPEDLLEYFMEKEPAVYDMVSDQMLCWKEERY